MEWQPIETAPKDGTLILLCGGATPEDGDRDERPVTAFWDDDAWAHSFWDSRWRGTYIDPTHWMPLPPPRRTDMTPEERQQVIDALNLAVLGSTTPRQLLTCRQAIAIIQRDAQQHEELARWMREHDAGGS